jgi:hypothetical protein
MIAQVDENALIFIFQHSRNGTPIVEHPEQTVQHEKRVACAEDFIVQIHMFRLLLSFASAPLSDRKKLIKMIQLSNRSLRLRSATDGNFVKMFRLRSTFENYF